MKHWMVRQLVLLLRAVFVAAGIGLSVAQAGSMAANMATMSDMAMSTQGDCQGCPDQTGDSAMKAMACGNVCTAAVLAALPAAVLLPVGEEDAPFAVREPLLHGRAAFPDPHPPRTSYIG